MAEANTDSVVDNADNPSNAPQSTEARAGQNACSWGAGSELNLNNSVAETTYKMDTIAMLEEKSPDPTRSKDPSVDHSDQGRPASGPDQGFTESTAANQKLHSGESEGSSAVRSAQSSPIVEPVVQPAVNSAPASLKEQDSAYDTSDRSLPLSPEETANGEPGNDSAQSTLPALDLRDTPRTDSVSLNTVAGEVGTEKSAEKQSSSATGSAGPLPNKNNPSHHEHGKVINQLRTESVAGNHNLHTAGRGGLLAESTDNGSDVALTTNPSVLQGTVNCGLGSEGEKENQSAGEDNDELGDDREKQVSGSCTQDTQEEARSATHDSRPEEMKVAEVTMSAGTANSSSTLEANLNSDAEATNTLGTATPADNPTASPTISTDLTVNESKTSSLEPAEGTNQLLAEPDSADNNLHAAESNGLPAQSTTGGSSDSTPTNDTVLLDPGNCGRDSEGKKENQPAGGNKVEVGVCGKNLMCDSRTQGTHGEARSITPHCRPEEARVTEVATTQDRKNSDSVSGANPDSPGAEAGEVGTGKSAEKQSNSATGSAGSPPNKNNPSHHEHGKVINQLRTESVAGNHNLHTAGRGGLPAESTDNGSDVTPTTNPSVLRDTVNSGPGSEGEKENQSAGEDNDELGDDREKQVSGSCTQDTQEEARSATHDSGPKEIKATEVTMSAGTANSSPTLEANLNSDAETTNTLGTATPADNPTASPTISTDLTVNESKTSDPEPAEGTNQLNAEPGAVNYNLHTDDSNGLLAKGTTRSSSDATQNTTALVLQNTANSGLSSEGKVESQLVEEDNVQLGVGVKNLISGSCTHAAQEGDRGSSSGIYPEGAQITEATDTHNAAKPCSRSDTSFDNGVEEITGKLGKFTFAEDEGNSLKTTEDHSVSKDNHSEDCKPVEESHQPPNEPNLACDKSLPVGSGESSADSIEQGAPGEQGSAASDRQGNTRSNGSAKSRSYKRRRLVTQPRASAPSGPEAPVGQIQEQAQETSQRSAQASAQMVYDIFGFTVGSIEILEMYHDQESWKAQDIQLSPESEKMLANWKEGAKELTLEGVGSCSESI